MQYAQADYCCLHFPNFENLNGTVAKDVGFTVHEFEIKRHSIRIESKQERKNKKLYHKQREKVSEHKSNEFKVSIEQFVWFNGLIAK